MNDLGKLFVSKNARGIAEYNKQNKDKYQQPVWEDSLFQERLMRIGTEVRAFEIHSDDIKELCMIATASLQESFLRQKQISNGYVAQLAVA